MLFKNRLLRKRLKRELPDALYSASKDWRESDWIGRIQWLKARCKAEREFRGAVEAEMQDLVRQIKALKS